MRGKEMVNIGSDTLNLRSLWISREMSRLKTEIQVMVMMMETMVVNLF